VRERIGEVGARNAERAQRAVDGRRSIEIRREQKRAEMENQKVQFETRWKKMIFEGVL
jgi:hypothetical protein